MYPESTPAEWLFPQEKPPSAIRGEGSLTLGPLQKILKTFLRFRFRMTARFFVI
jgi:hypothetical protein